VIEAIKNPEEVPETLHKLSSTVFVQSVDNPAHILKNPVYSSRIQYTYKGTDFRELASGPVNHRPHSPAWVPGEED
jgi:hypothetical protein